jgi:phosphatidylserine/phosphatidylglycerophosphate/cardiolipin synthase-like enzyme
MTDVLLTLSEADLAEIAKALRSRRLTPPYSTAALGRLLAEPSASFASIGMRQFDEQGFSSEQTATVIELLIRQRWRESRAEESIDLVTTGPETPGAANRDTAVVVREMFASAERSVLVAGFAVYQGQRVFEVLADRMEALPNLEVRLFLDVHRSPGDPTPATAIVRQFAHGFREHQWPQGRRLPEVRYDPRSLAIDTPKRACLHAKCIVVDRKEAFITSANFTEAAHERNLEVGVLIRSTHLANRLASHFDSLVTAEMLVRAL